MKRRVEVVASARRAAASLFGFLILLAAPALAGDRALAEFLGFSGDAKYFAFEEYGYQDGSGFAYANIYVIDLEADRWVSGTPVRVRAEDENATLADIRIKARTEAGPTLLKIDITTPADIAVLIGDGEPDADAKTLAFGRPGYAAGVVLDERQLSLETFPASSAEDCEGFFGTAPLGFELTLSGGDAPVTLHRDEGQLPQSRGCPLDYRLYAVILPGDYAPQDRGVAMVSVYPGGFEGPDRRFLAVPFAF